MFKVHSKLTVNEVGFRVEMAAPLQAALLSAQRSHFCPNILRGEEAVMALLIPQVDVAGLASQWVVCRCLSRF